MEYEDNTTKKDVLDMKIQLMEDQANNEDLPEEIREAFVTQVIIAMSELMKTGE